MKILPLSRKAFFGCICIASVFFFVCSADAQTTSGVSSDGRDFYLGYIQPNYNTKIISSYTLPLFRSFALISSYVDSRITVSYFDDASGTEMLVRAYFIPARTGFQVPLDVTKMLMDDPGDIPQYRACHITSDHPVNIQYFSCGADAGGSYLALATQALGKKYVIASYNDNPGAGNIADTSEGIFLIVSTFDRTTIKITPNATTKGGHSGAHSGAHITGVASPYTVNLNRGQCYLVKSGSSEGDVDISGSIVESDKPVAVLGGHENASLGAVDMTFDPRDFMVEQMIPVDFWDTTGYVSIPLKDSQPADPTNEGAGENYRVYTFDSSGSNVFLTESGIGTRDMTVGRLAYPTPERFQVTTPVEFHATNGKKFGVMMYDQRNYATSPPFPAPSMMTILPISRWAKSYSWVVPDYSPVTDFVKLRQYFINIIGSVEDIETGINISYNGGGLKPLKQLLSLDGEFTSIPHHPELHGARVNIYPGSFYATSYRPFIIYSFGFEGLGGDKENPPDGDEWYSSNANPVGALLSSGDSSKLRTVIDSQCTQWNICAIDDRKNDPGIRSVSLLKDPQGVQFSPGKQSFNCRIDQLYDPNNFGELELDGTSTNFCFDISIDDPLSPAYAAFLISDNAGNVKLTELHYSPPVFTRTPNATTINVGGVPVNTDSCISISLKNSESLTHTVLSAKMIATNHFTISSIHPPLPAILKKNDSVIIKVCYACGDSLPAINTLSILIDCFTVPLNFTANGITGLISATDLNFGNTDTGKSIVKTVSVSNIGQENFTLTKNWTLSGSKAFALADSTKLPAILSPGQILPLRISYTPTVVGHDSAMISWATTIEAPYTQRIKSYSRLIGQAAVPVASVGESSSAKKLSVRPNPASGRSIIVSFNGMNTEKVEVHIFDVLGREVYKRNLLLHGSINEQTEIPIGNLQNGIYYAKLIIDGKILTEKFEVMR